jgi:large subunit ribosomal protein L23
MMGVIVKPLVTEKMNRETEKLNRFGFIVRPESNKIEIKKAVEEMYNVTVLSVNTVRYSGKTKNRWTRAGLIKGRTDAYKKAIVTLKDGDTIDFYSNI